VWSGAYREERTRRKDKNKRKDKRKGRKGGEQSRQDNKQTMVSHAVSQLLAEGAAAMASKNYEDAVEIYSEACQVANLESEDGRDDPDLMYLYGRALFENAVASSDVIGMAESKTNANAKDDGMRNGKEAGEKGDNEEEGKDAQFQFTENVAVEEEEEEDAKDEAPLAEGEEEEESSDEEVEAPADGEVEAEQSDFEIAWEILDLTRLLYTESLDSMGTAAVPPEPFDEHRSESEGDTFEVYTARFVKLADVYMLMGDISLETENFPQGVKDYGEALSLLRRAFPATSGRIRECLFKLSLAQEFVGDDECLDAAVECMDEVVMMVDKKVDAELYLDVVTRLADLKNVRKERAKEKEQLRGLFKDVAATLQEAGTTSGEKRKDAPVANDLSGLVKRRKKQ
jgi:HAT1-interacting factor 1